MFFFNLVVRKVHLFTNKQEFFNIIVFKGLQAISEFVRGNMEPCYWKFDPIMLRSISNQQNYEMFHIRLNNFPVFRNYRDIVFALHCMDDLATNAKISMNWNLMLNFVKLKQRIFKRHSSFYWPNAGVGDIEKLCKYIYSLGVFTEKPYSKPLERNVVYGT